jgi:signal transduction histidine kinase
VIRRLLAPLVRGTTYRRGVYLLLGGVLALPYVLLGTVFARLLVTNRPERVLVLLLMAVTAVIATVPAFLTGTRALEIVAVRWLLQVELPDPPPTAERETRLRTALWFAVHLAVGAAVATALLIAIPLAFAYLGQWVPGNPLLLSVGGVALLLGLPYAVAGLGALAATMAPVLLGPSATERIAALEARAAQLAERNRLARELHDSVGHALTVTTLQAAAARELLDTDPAFVARALGAIEDAGRTAMDELDRVLGVLRDGEPARLAPVHTLADLDRLVHDARSEVSLTVRGDLAALPAPVSREGYRIVQECLTNALRHAGPVPVEVCLTVHSGAIEIEATNPSDNGGAVAGRGLTGMRERVTLLGGTLRAGPEPGRWRVHARLPVQDEP